MREAWAVDKDGLRLSLVVIPKSSGDKIVGLQETIDGERLKVKVRAVPENGKANLSVIKLLSKVLNVPKSSFEILSGHGNRRKTVKITGQSENILQALKNAIELGK